MQKHIFILLGIILTFLLISCNDGGTEPENPIPGRRDYIWSVDTLFFTSWGDLAITNMLVRDTNDIYIVGFGYKTDECVIHFNGADFEFIKQDVSRFNYSIFEFKEKIYIGTGYGKLFSLNQDGTLTLEFNDASGQSVLYFPRHFNNQLYIGGTKTGRAGFTIIKNDGGGWKYWYSDNEPDVFMASFEIINDFAYILSTSDVYNLKLYSLTNNSLNFVQELSSSNLFKMDNRIYLLVDDGNLKRIETGKVMDWLRLEGKGVYGAAVGRSESDIVVYHVNSIGHFNGNDLEDIYTLQGDYGIHAVHIDQNNIYFIVKPDDVSYYLLIKGKLK
ncbi:MAG: hypothetical protein SCALA702_00750 [Melioribacteraceae bacterium]|nr:MAG: hypothetical protein SCALA702_00750 [Melioribacteraceae bacterium]